VRATRGGGDIRNDFERNPARGERRRGAACEERGAEAGWPMYWRFCNRIGQY